MSITHVGWYHEVLIQPADRRAGTITILRDDATAVIIERKLCPLDRSRRGVRNGYRIVILCKYAPGLKRSHR